MFTIAASLIYVSQEWQSTRLLSDRIANIRGVGTGERANADIFLTPATTALVDDAVDTLLGEEDGDWLLFDETLDVLGDFDLLEDDLTPL